MLGLPFLLGLPSHTDYSADIHPVSHPLHTLDYTQFSLMKVIIPYRIINIIVHVHIYRTL